MSYNEFKTIDEQLEALRSKGLIIDNDAEARQFLFCVGYYTFKGYSRTLSNHGDFYPGTRFKNIMDIYMFDHELRHVLLKYIEKIEVRFKSIYAYRFAQMHNPDTYLDIGKFTDDETHSSIVSKADYYKNQRIKHDENLKAIEDSGQVIPIWAYLEFVSFGEASLLYSITDAQVKDVIAADYGLTVSSKADIIRKFIHRMVDLRNLCAHWDRLHNFIFSQKPFLNKHELGLLIRKPDGSYDNEHLYAFVIVMRRLLMPDEFSEMKSKIIDLNKKYPFVHMRHYGFRDDWREKL